MQTALTLHGVQAQLETKISDLKTYIKDQLIEQMKKDRDLERDDKRSTQRQREANAKFYRDLAWRILAGVGVVWAFLREVWAAKHGG